MPGGRILIVDDHAITREGLSLAARAALAGVTIVPAATIADAADAMKTRPAFRMILLDYHLPDAHGYSGLLKLQHLDPAIPIVVVTAREDPVLVEAARALGAAGFLCKRLTLDAMTAALKTVAGGGRHFPAVDVPRAVVDITAAHDRIAGLSPAQHAVLMLLGQGRSNKQIAIALDVTEATVKAHMTAILRKLGVGNRAQALLAIQPLFRAG